MSNLLIIEDRMDFKEVLYDWIETKIPEGESWVIKHCEYFKEDECLEKIKESDIILMSMSSDNQKHFNFFLSIYGQGLLDQKRIFLMSDENLPHVPLNPNVEIYKCYETDFVTDCIDKIMGAQPI